MVVKRGDMFYADLSPVVGSEQGGIRPVLIIQNDTGNKYSPTVIAAAIPFVLSPVAYSVMMGFSTFASVIPVTSLRSTSSPTSWGPFVATLPT